MRTTAKWMVRGGLVVWVFGTAAAISGVWVTLPPDATKWLVLGLASTSGGMLVLSGMALGRGARRTELPVPEEPRSVSAGTPDVGARAAMKSERRPAR